MPPSTSSIESAQSWRVAFTADGTEIAAEMIDHFIWPGTVYRYSNPGMAMLGYCVTASLRSTDDADLRSLLKQRIMGPLGVPDAEWSVGYSSTTTVEGLPLVAPWGGGSYSPDAVARARELRLI